MWAAACKWVLGRLGWSGECVYHSDKADTIFRLSFLKKHSPDWSDPFGHFSKLGFLSMWATQDKVARFSRFFFPPKSWKLQAACYDALHGRYKLGRNFPRARSILSLYRAPPLGACTTYTGALIQAGEGKHRDMKNGRESLAIL